MPPTELLIMALTRMKAGVCTAGFSKEPHLDSHLRWVRPVKSSKPLLLDDLRDSTGRIVEIGDVVTFNLLQPTLQHSRPEDWLTDFFQQRVCVKYHLKAQKWADFLANHFDKDPLAILQSQSRSLCLLKPDDLWVKFAGNIGDGTYEARLGFQLQGSVYPQNDPQKGIPVTDIKWRALGRHWLAQDEKQELCLNYDAVCQRLAADVLYLSVGLSLPFKGKIWPLVIGIHPVPDYNITIDYTTL